MVPPLLFGPFEEPHLLVPIDRTRPNISLGKSFIAQLSATHSSVFNFDVRPALAGKTCNLVFYLPAETSQWWQTYRLTTPGGLTASRLDQPATETTSFDTVGSSRPVGHVDQLTYGLGHVLESAPCEAGKKVGYRLDALHGLDLQLFQMVTPASGLFMTISGQ